ncbi:cytokine receptor-like factor 2 [Sigmodon hispidus]
MSVPTWPIVVILLLQLLLTSGEENADDSFRVSIICWNLETVEVTWDPAHYVGVNLSLSFRYNLDPPRSCPSYILSAGITSGCVFPARRLARLEINILKGKESIYNRKQLATAYLKPRPPGNVTFHWLEDTVRVTCTDLPYGGLFYEVQHRGAMDPVWETSSETTCDVTVNGVNPQHCYDFRVRVTTQEQTYGRKTYPSDWTQVTHWRAAQRTESCQEPPTPAFPKFLVTCGLLTLLTLLLLLLSLWRLQRVKNALMPCVPDPKGSFPGLFEKHGGDFQEWITNTQHVTLMVKPEVGDPAEEALVVEHYKKGAEPVWNGAQGYPSFPHKGPQGGDLVSVGGIMFVMDSNAYMTL